MGDCTLRFFSTPFEKPTEMPKINTNKRIPVLVTSKDCRDLANKRTEELMNGIDY